MLAAAVAASLAAGPLAVPLAGPGETVVLAFTGEKGNAPYWVHLRVYIAPKPVLSDVAVRTDVRYFDVHHELPALGEQAARMLRDAGYTVTQGRTPGHYVVTTLSNPTLIGPRRAVAVWLESGGLPAGQGPRAYKEKLNP